MHLTRLNCFTWVRACRSLCLRSVMVVTSHDVRLDSCWLARPWQGRNCTSWMDEASSGRTPEDCRKLLPGLTAEIKGGVLSPRHGHVNPILTSRSLARSAAQLGVEFRLHTEVTRVLVRNG